MSQTSGDSVRNEVEICFSTLVNNPEKKHEKYKIFNGPSQNARIEINIGPGMEIKVEDGINTTPEKMSQIAKQQQERLTEKQVAKRNNDIEK